MDRTARLFNCVRCHAQVIICPECDRGQIYCGHECAQSVRRASLKAAGQRYQNTHRGRIKHAKRQQRYRERQRAKIKKVTHQGSLESTRHDVLFLPSIEKNELESMTVKKPLHCRFCKKPVSNFLRNGFLRHLSKMLAPMTKRLAQGP